MRTSSQDRRHSASKEVSKELGTRSTADPLRRGFAARRCRRIRRPRQHRANAPRNREPSDPTSTDDAVGQRAGPANAATRRTAQLPSPTSCAKAETESRPVPCSPVFESLIPPGNPSRSRCFDHGRENAPQARAGRCSGSSELDRRADRREPSRGRRTRGAGTRRLAGRLRAARIDSTSLDESAERRREKSPAARG